MENKTEEFFCPCELFNCHQPYGHWLNDPRKQDARKLAKALLEIAVIVAVIIGIINGDRILLTKYRTGYANYALVAGLAWCICSR